jgi:hypothetical protein
MARVAVQIFVIDPIRGGHHRTGAGVQHPRRGVDDLTVGEHGDVGTDDAVSLDELGQPAGQPLDHHCPPSRSL